MIKYLVLILIALSVGYGFGYRDATRYKKTVVERVVERVGGSNRGKYNQDLDRATDSVR